jgi:hypothetical protein
VRPASAAGERNQDYKDKEHCGSTTSASSHCCSFPRRRRDTPGAHIKPGILSVEALLGTLREVSQRFFRGPWLIHNIHREQTSGATNRCSLIAITDVATERAIDDC